MEEAESNAANAENFCLKWSNYQSHVLGVLVQLLEAESMIDVTLCTSTGEKLYAHKIILCAASSYFADIFSDLDDYHPVVILSEVEPAVLRSILEFVYHGELNIHSSQLTEVLQVAAALQIKGLTEVSDQLPYLVPSDVDASPSNQHDTSTHTEMDQEIPTSEEVVNNVLVVAPYCSDVDTVSASDIVYEDPSIEHQENEELSISEMDKGNCQIQLNSFTEASEENSSNGNENWTISSCVGTDSKEGKRRKRRESCRKEYSEDQLTAALRDLRNGELLRQTAAAHNIPRSTLYVRAKSEGIPITVSRQEHSGENVTAAVQAVNQGVSLQQASDLYQIPKTVLWRRVKAAGASVSRAPTKSYGTLHWQAAVQALQEGQTLSKVSAQFRIPKTTLFREKARLVEAGKLPNTSLKKRDPFSHSMKHSRLKEAVAACKEGKMSQAVASITYQVPKTTIWRKLHKGMPSIRDQNKKSLRSVKVTDSTMTDTTDTVTGNLQEQTQFTFVDNSQLPVAYIVEEDYSPVSLII